MISRRLPVSGLAVRLQAPTGRDEMAVAEAPAVDTALAVDLAQRLATGGDGEPLDWMELPVADLDAAVLMLRQSIAGDAIRADARCTADGCGSRVDIAFRISDLLAHHAPVMPPAVRREIEMGAARPVETGGQSAGWFALEGVGRFRLPTAADVMASTETRRPEDALRNRCICPPGLPARERRKIERSMEAMAPSLSAPVQGACPDCGADVTVLFDPQYYVLTEMRDQAAFVLAEVALLAGAFHWSEAEILDMPAARRRRYAELARDARRSE